MAAASVMPLRLFLRLLLLLAVAGACWSQTLLDPEPRTCRTKDNNAVATASQGRRNEYPAGGVLMVLANMPTGLFGSLEVYLCPNGEAKEECLDRVPLQLSDGSGTSYDLSKVPRTDKFEIPVILPDDVTCVTCTLQMRVVSRTCKDEAACPATEQVTCADLTVREIKSPKKRGLRKKLSKKMKKAYKKTKGYKDRKLAKMCERYCSKQGCAPSQDTQAPSEDTQAPSQDTEEPPQDTQQGMDYE